MQPAVYSTHGQEASPSHFDKFNELPAELRIKIWQLAMPEARTVIVKSPYSRNRPAPRSLEDAMAQADIAETWYSNAQIPALLHVNAEARHEALKRYTLALAVQGQEPRIYIDFARDTLFIGDSELTPECLKLWFSTADMERIQQLAVVPEGAWRVLRWTKIDFHTLHKITFVHDSDHLDLGSSPRLLEDQFRDQVDHPAERLEKVHEKTQVSHAPEDAAKRRMQAAQEELETLQMVASTDWSKKPSISTAVFGHS